MHSTKKENEIHQLIMRQPNIEVRSKFEDIHQSLKKLLLNSQSIQGLNLLALGDKNPQQLNNALEELISLMLENKIKPKANHEFNFNEIADAHQGVEEGKFIGKVFVKV